MSAKSIKEEKTSREAFKAEADADPEVQFIASWYKADDEKATEADAAKVRIALKNLPNPEVVEILKQNVERMLIKSCVSGRGSRVISEHEIECMRKRYDYENLSELERAHVDRIILCWLRLLKCEAERAAYDKGSHLISHIELAEKHLQLAHTRYMRALEQLAKVQFLMSRTNQKRLAAVREAMKPQQDQQGQLIEMRPVAAG
jgi:hypothetical protein